VVGGIDPAVVLGDKPTPPPQPESRQLPPLYPPP